MTALRVPRRGRIPDRLLGWSCAGIWLLVLNCLQNLRTAPRVPAGLADLEVLRGPKPWPRVSILVPARDEGANIADCLRGLLAQSYPATEVIVCDDRSVDDTATIVSALAAEYGDGRLRLLAGAERPPDWSGKNWACHQLAGAARGDWLLFTDADTRHGSDSVAAALALAWRHDADLVSLLPKHRTETWGERLLVPQLALLIWAFLPLSLVGNRARWAEGFFGANGLYLLFRRDWYDTLGGYPAVRAEIAEDMRFAQLTKWRGGRLLLADGSAVLDCRMYQSFDDAWRGLSRNAFPAALHSSPVFWLVITIWTWVFVVPLVVVVWAFVRRLTPPPAPPLEGRGVSFATLSLPATARSVACEPPLPCRGGAGGGVFPVALAAILGQVVLRLLAGQRSARPAWEALLQPLSSFLTLGVLLNSYRLHRLGGSFDWRGRSYGTADRKAYKARQ